MEITLDYSFPDDPSLKNKIWNEKIKPAREEFLKRLQHEKICVDLGLPVEATQKEVDALIKEIKRANRREKAEAKRIEAEAQEKRIQADAEAKQRSRELAAKMMQARRELEAIWIQSAREMEAKRIQAEKMLEAKRNEAKRASLGLNAEADAELAVTLFKSAE
ncbi:MAG: hypothetical protein ED554_13305 [Synechococcus sp. YX04-3]|nr:MAG: hypothetical protein ED554_13305 [Synechococcus sp. YX04-3]